MGACGLCPAGNCISSYYFEKEVYIQGNIIFKPINTNLDINNEQLFPEEKQTLENCKKLLEEIENERKEIAAKFESFLFNTGGCVLTQPTMEKGLTTFLVYLMTQILICAKEKRAEFNIDDFSLGNFISISKNPPFIELNNEILNNIKNKYGFDFNMIESLVTGKDSIIDFLSTLAKTKSLIQKQMDILKNLLKQKISDIFMLKQIYLSKDSVRFLFSYFSEISNGLIETQLNLTKPSKIETYYRIASEAAEKNIKDPKEIALLYANGDNCGKIENWKDNITYKEIESIKY
jgi:hypothetical protein